MSEVPLFRELVSEPKSESIQYSEPAAEAWLLEESLFLLKILNLFLFFCLAICYWRCFSIAFRYSGIAYDSLILLSEKMLLRKSDSNSLPSFLWSNCLVVIGSSASGSSFQMKSYITSSLVLITWTSLLYRRWLLNSNLVLRSLSSSIMSSYSAAFCTSIMSLIKAWFAFWITSWISALSSTIAVAFD